MGFDGWSDAALVAAIARRDHDAFDEAFDRHAPASLRVARRHVRRADLAEEVVQEVFLRLWDRPERFRPERGSLRSWILTDTSGRCLDLLRAESARRTREDHDGRCRAPAVDDPADEVSARWEVDQLLRALRDLDDARRAAVATAYLAGLSYRATASALGRPEGTVKRRIGAALRELRASLGDAVAER